MFFFSQDNDYTIILRSNGTGSLADFSSALMLVNFRYPAMANIIANMPDFTPR